LSIIIPIFCNIGNPFKRFDVTDVTYAERITLLHLDQVGRRSLQLYPYGIRFKVVVDATFYSTPFHNSVIETNRYYQSLKEYVTSAGLSQHIEVLDMMDLLSQRSVDFTDRFHFWMNRLTDEHKADATLSLWTKSMLNSINLRHLQNDYETLVACYDDTTDNDIRLDHWRRAKESLILYRALKNAAVDIEWETLVAEHWIRSTIHTKRIPVLGLRIYPEYKKSSKLLPYHGVAVFFSDPGKNRIRMKILPEIEAILIPDVKRIINSEGRTQAYIVGGQSNLIEKGLMRSEAKGM
jgi:pyoverdine/dityrosine biosynthesis protein Dit1